MKHTVLAWMGAATLALLVGCVPGGGGGGGNDDGGVIPVGGSGGGAGGGAGGGGGAACVPACVDGQQCGPDGCGGVCGTCEEGLRCIEGMCSDAACPAGTLDCAGVCTELLSDADNCGSCGNACPRQEGLIAECVQAECYLTCPEFSGQGVNIDTDTDAANCGGCGNECPAIGGAAVCGAGACVDPCVEQGLTGCGQECIDTNFDPENCGECGQVCPTAINGFPICEGGVCGDPCGGLPQCDGECVDTNEDTFNCGACGVRCGEGQICAGGTCECEGGGGQDLDTDPDNCGFCGNSCPAIEGGERACNAGNCADACGGDLNECNGACVNLASDVDNCGGCEIRCGDLEVVEPPTRFWLDEAGAGVEPGGCLEGDCAFLVSRAYRFPNRGGVIENCNHVCAEAGARCTAQPIGLEVCPDGDGGGVPLNANAVGCTVYRGVQSTDAEPVAACGDPILPRSGFAGDNRTAISCVCEGVNPPEAFPPLGIGVPQSGGYNYQTADHEIVLMRLESLGGVIQVETEQPGYLNLYNADGNELADAQELNFGVFVGAEVEPGTYYVAYRTFPEHAQEIGFVVNF